MSTDSSSKLHCNLSGCGALYPLQADVHDDYAFFCSGHAGGG